MLCPRVFFFFAGRRQDYLPEAALPLWYRIPTVYRDVSLQHNKCKNDLQIKRLLFLKGAFKTMLQGQMCISLKSPRCFKIYPTKLHANLFVLNMTQASHFTFYIFTVHPQKGEKLAKSSRTITSSLSIQNTEDVYLPKRQQFFRCLF